MQTEDTVAPEVISPIPPTPTGSPATGHAAAFHRLGESLQQLNGKHTERQAFLSELAMIVQRYLDTDVVAHFCDAGGSGKKPRLMVLSSTIERVDDSIQRWCLSFGARCVAGGQTLLETDAVRTSVQLFAIPLVGSNAQTGSDCLVMLFASPPEDSHFRSAALHLLSAHVTAWNAEQEQDKTDGLTRQLAAITDLLARVELSDNRQQACQLVAEHLRHHLDCEHVVIGLCRAGNPACEVQATSGTTGLEQSSDPDRLAQAVLQESISRGTLAQWPPPEQDRHGLLAHRQYAKSTNADTIISSPLLDNHGNPRGAWLVVGQSDSLTSRCAEGFLEATGRPLASTLQLLERAHQNRLQRGFHETVESFRRGKSKSVLGLIGLVAGVLLIPMPYKVKSECELQPTHRRFIAAPFAGRLESAFTQPGDIVEANQIIARMDGREIAWELAGIQAELHRATKERAGHVAAHESGKARLAQHDIDRLRSKTELLEHRGGNLDIRAPLAGVVVSGDLTKSEGIPLSIGQTLFEVAPLDRMIVEVAIPEDDVRFVTAEMIVEIRLDAFPFQKWEATIERINPRSELKNNDNVFIAEATIANLDRSMRPGMRGSAKIITPRHPLGWNLFHKAAAVVWRWCGW